MRVVTPGLGARRQINARGSARSLLSEGSRRQPAPGARSGPVG